MLVGMGTVFVFLTLLVMATLGMSTLIQRFFPPVATAPAVPQHAVGASAGEPHEEEIAAITIALRQHLKRTEDQRVEHKRDTT